VVGGGSDGAPIGRSGREAKGARWALETATERRKGAGEKSGGDRGGSPFIPVCGEVGEEGGSGLGPRHTARRWGRGPTRSASSGRLATARP
jgi:hypothetical protein